MSHQRVLVIKAVVGVTSINIRALVVRRISFEISKATTSVVRDVRVWGHYSWLLTDLALVDLLVVNVNLRLIFQIHRVLL